MLIRGNPAHPHLVFLHGLFGCKEDWEAMISFLSHAYYCVAIDMSDVTLLKQFVRPTLVGYSRGGRVALQFREYAERIVLISAHVGLETEEEKREQRHKEQEWRHKLLTLSPQEFFTAWYTQPLFASLSQSLREELIHKRASQNPQMMDPFCLSEQERVTQFSQPVLLIHGEKDCKYRQLYATLSLPVVQIENAGHACHLENPHACSQAILNWNLCTH